DLDAALGVLGHVGGGLADGDDVAAAELDHVPAGVDVGDAQAPVGRDATGGPVQVRARAEPPELARDAGRGSHLKLYARPGPGALAGLDRVQVEVGRGTRESLHGDAPHRDLLDELLPVRVEGAKPVDLVVLDPVGGGVAQDHQRVEQ